MQKKGGLFPLGSDIHRLQTSPDYAGCSLLQVNLKLQAAYHLASTTEGLQLLPESAQPQGLSKDFCMVRWKASKCCKQM